MTRPQYINGRILLRDHGGVRRYAAEISRHLEGAVVLQPRSADHVWSGRVWEQTALPRSASDGVLLNMAHSAPLRHKRQINVVHDLLALTDPQGVHPAYTALLRRQLPAYISSAQRVVTVSAHVAKQVAGLFDLERDDIAIVPPGISSIFQRGDRATARGRLGLDADRPVIAALLDPVPRKNSAVVAELLHELLDENPRLQIVVAGRPQPLRFSRARTTSDIARADVVDVGFDLDLGAAADIELATMYQAADVFVSLSDAEGFGLPVIEAARCGAAVVSTPMPSLTEHAPTGAVIVRDPSEAKTAIIGLLNDAAHRDELVMAAADALGDLQWSQSAASLETMMSEVASA